MNITNKKTLNKKQRFNYACFSFAISLTLTLVFMPSISSAYDNENHSTQASEQTCGVKGEFKGSCITAKFIPPDPTDSYEDIMSECVDNVSPEDIEKIKLLAGLGDDKYPLVSIVDISTQSDFVEAFYSQGMTLQYGFNFARAIRSFYKAILLDESAAMAYWGIALSANSNINSNATDGCNRLAYASAQRAKNFSKLQLGDPLYKNNFDILELERQLKYAKAFNSFYVPDNVKNPIFIYITVETKWDYVKSMQKLSEVYKLDLDATTLYANAMLNINPWKWWTGSIIPDDDAKPSPEADIALEELNDVIVQDPVNVGANHLYVHAIEESPSAASGMIMAERLESLVPSAGHLVHMPSHIYQRIGDNATSSAANYRAIQIDRSYLDQVQTDDAYPLHYLGHNIYFLTWTLSIEGRENDSLIMAKELIDNTVYYSNNDFLCRNFPEKIRVKTDYFFAASIYFAVRFQNWKFLTEINSMIDDGLKEINGTCLKPPDTTWKKFEIPYTTMIRAYSVAYETINLPTTIGLLQKSETDKALGDLELFWDTAKSEFNKDKDLQYGNNDAINLIRIANLNLVTLWLDTEKENVESLEALQELMTALKNSNAEILYRDVFCEENNCGVWEGKTNEESIIRLWTNAVTIQDELNYNEPPDWYYTSRESLGFAHLKQATKTDADSEGSADLAVRVFLQDLFTNRRSGRSLCGLIQGLELQGKAVFPRFVRRFRQAWKNANISADMNQNNAARQLLDAVGVSGPHCPRIEQLSE